jgi:hypothetical protein
MLFKRILDDCNLGPVTLGTREGSPALRFYYKFGPSRIGRTSACKELRLPIIWLMYSKGKQEEFPKNLNIPKSQIQRFFLLRTTLKYGQVGGS